MTPASGEIVAVRASARQAGPLSSGRWTRQKETDMGEWQPIESGANMSAFLVLIAFVVFAKIWLEILEPRP